MGLILGCGSIRIPHTQDNDNPNDNKEASTISPPPNSDLRIRLLNLDYTHDPWGFPHSSKVIIKRWLNALLKRLQLDRTIATKTRRTGKMINFVHSTWTDIVDPDNSLHKNWVTPEVLVGITLPRPRRPGPGSHRAPHYSPNAGCA